MKKTELYFLKTLSYLMIKEFYFRIWSKSQNIEWQKLNAYSISYVDKHWFTHTHDIYFLYFYSDIVIPFLLDHFLWKEFNKTFYVQYLNLFFKVPSITNFTYSLTVVVWIVLHKRYVQVLTSTVCDCNLIWKYDLCRY